MGGYNSGRHGWRPHIESLRCLDLTRMMKLRAVVPGIGRSGSWIWSDGDTGEQRANIGYTVTWHNSYSGSLRLRYTFTLDEESESKDYTVPLVGHSMRYGGFRWYCRCPATRRLALKLYMVKGLFVARTAIRPLPTYAIQRAGRGLDRITARRWALRRRLGDPGDLLCELQKPRWMRRRTFQRFTELDDRLAGAEDMAFLGRAARLMAFS